jgi:hypothetical protein
MESTYISTTEAYMLIPLHMRATKLVRTLLVILYSYQLLYNPRIKRVKISTGKYYLSISLFTLEHNIYLEDNFCLTATYLPLK